MNWHYIEQYIANAQHRITINLIGCGGTGSHVLTNLAMMNYALTKINRQPLLVRAWDPDVITEHNVGRQMFSPADIGRSKAEILIERINRFYGTGWEYQESMFDPDRFLNNDLRANISISCVDSVKSRATIYKALETTSADIDGLHNELEYHKQYYWIDIGNEKSSGQVLLSSLRGIKQPKGGIDNLPNFFDEFSDAKDDPSQPSCSMAEALAGQDLFINKIMATYAAHMLWDLLINFRIDYRGIYVNLLNMKTSKMLINHGTKK